MPGEPIVLTGPNLTLADLRYLVARCEPLDPGCPVQIRERAEHPARYEQIIVAPRRISAV